MMATFKSFLADEINTFIQYRKACNRWNEDSYELNLSLFDKYCFEKYPNYNALTQDMVDIWCRKRDTETNNSCMSRIYVVVMFVRFLQERNLTKIHEPAIPKQEARMYVPHFFTHDELSAFFKACDCFTPERTPLKYKLNMKYTIPVLFRLLYSSGIRTTEARMLKRKNVDLTNGVLNIINSKGFEDRYVVLHDSMIPIMRKYDSIIEKLYPGREYFFPGAETPYRGRTWIAYCFRTIWKQVNDSKALPYELRHNYAIENINKLIDRGMSFHDNMVYLSKSMGHTSVDVTVQYYYHLVPALSEILQRQTEEGFNDIVPEVHYEKG